VGTVTFGEDGMPTPQSLSKVMGVISEQARNGGRIEAAEFKITSEEIEKGEITKTSEREVVQNFIYYTKVDQSKIIQ
jgi:hypothetical protein